MAKIVYSHRIVSVLQQVVGDLGLTVTFTDENTDIDLIANEATFREASDLLGLTFTKLSGASGHAFRFSKPQG